MSYHSICKPNQLILNGERVEKLGRKVRISDAGIQLRHVLAAKPTDQQLEKMNAASQARVRRSNRRAEQVSG